jgi:hypothetical protein
MLAQYAQVMGIKAAQQEMEGNNALRDAYASGGDLNDPAFRQRVMAANPRVGSQLIKTNAETGKLQNEAVLKRIELSREMLTGVNTPEDYLAWHESNHKDPVLGGYLNQRGVTAEQSRAKIIAALNSPGGLEKLKRESALGATTLQKELMQTERSVQVAGIGAAAGNRNATVNEQRFALEKAEQENIARILRGEPPVATSGAPVAPMIGGGGGVAPMFGGGGALVVAPMSSPAPVGGGVAPVNALAPNVAPVTSGTPAPVETTAQSNVNALNVPPAATVAPNVNALTTNALPPQIAQLQTQISQLISSGSPKAIAAADALIKQHNLLMPTRQIVQNTKGEFNAIDQRTGSSTPVLNAEGKQLVGKLPPEQFESEYKKIVGKSAAERDVALVTSANAAKENLPKLYETLDQIKTSDAITGFGANVIKNIEAARAKFANDIKSGKKVADTEILDAMLGSDVFPMIQSLGIGARGMDTPAEREYLRGVMTGTITMNREALIKLTEIRKNLAERAIDLYNDAGARGKLDKFFETQGDKFDFMYPPQYIPKTTTPQSGGSVRVTLPDGRSVTLPNADAAAKFKKDAGIQ